MKAELSPLKLHDFLILNYQFDFKIPKREIRDLEKLFSSYSVEVDFEFKVDEDSDMFMVELFLKINGSGRRKAGYVISAACSGVFSLEESNLSEDAKANLRSFSSVNILIGQLRNFIAQQTALAPFGVYWLPPINILDLHNKKLAALEAQQS
ncbi:MAG: hypothetical protein Kow00127_16930 [Bacteroidales bacterium]